MSISCENMITKFLVSVVIALAMTMLNTADGADGVSHLTAADQSFAKYMMKSKFNDDPGVVGACFEYFIPTIASISDEFEYEYLACSATEKERIDNLNEAASNDRYDIELSADNVCQTMVACSGLVDALEFFDCYTGQGGANSKTLYDVTQNATDRGGELHEHYRIVETEKYKCQNASQRAYVEKSADCYRDLTICLQTGYIPSTVGPNTTTPAVSTTTDDDNDSTSSSLSTPSTMLSTPSTPTSTDDDSKTSTTPLPNDYPMLSGRGMKVLPELRRFWRN